MTLPDRKAPSARTRAPSGAAWSTRQLAELAGTTVRTIRHYHQIGLLEEPARSRNGYKHYGTAHLVRLLKIRRLAALGLTLAQIAGLEDLGRCPAELLQTLEHDLGAQIERLQQARSELAGMLA